MIAFVIVAAALAFVVLNMGFTTSQKAKTTIISSLGEASSSMQITGKVIGSGYPIDSVLNVTAFPIKITSGGDHINLDAKTTAVKYLSNSINYGDIYVGTLSGEFKSLASAVSEATDTLTTDVGDETFSQMNINPFSSGSNEGIPPNTRAFIYFTQETNSNDILERGEIAVLAIVYGTGERPAALDRIKAEIIVASGSALTVERQVPIITTTVVDLG